MSGRIRTFLSSWMIMTAVAVQGAGAQYAEDALRFSQNGLGVGGRSLGMGNANVGVADDYSALFWNPAGLALQRNFEFSVGLDRFGYANNVAYLGSKLSSDNNMLNLNNLGLVYPVPTTRGSLTFALGFNRAANYTSTASMDAFNPSSSIIQSMIPATNLKTLSSADRTALLDHNIAYQLYLANIDTTRGVLYPLVTGRVQQTVNVLEGGGMNHWTLGGAMDVGKDLSVGVSLNFSSGSYSYDRRYAESDVQNLYRTFPADFDRMTYQSTINSDLTGFNALFGLMFRRPGAFKVGVAIRTTTEYDVSESFADNAQSRFKPDSTGYVFSASYSSNNTTKYKVTTPYVLSGGLSVQVFDWLLLAGDAEYIDWKRMAFNSDNPDLAAENSRIKDIMQTTTNLRVGGEVSLWSLGLKLRAGMIYNPSPYKGDPKSRDQVYYTGGAGYMLNDHTTVNAAVTYGTWKTLRANYTYPSGTNLIDVVTDETVNATNVNLTLSYRF